MNARLSLTMLFVALGLSVPAAAELADRNQPVKIEANRITIDDSKKVQVFEGNVQLQQGTMMLRAERLVVSQDANGYQKGIAYGSSARPATFRQKREGRNDYIEGEAERIEHDAHAERTELFNKARIKNGADEVQGQYVSYDAKSENYIVSGAAPGTSQDASGRVKAVIVPKTAPSDPASEK